MTEQTATSTRMKHLDGTTLEGGGQLLRLALSLSSLTYIPIQVTNIRGKRGPISSPGKDGGLKSAHLAAVTWLARATAAETEGMEAKSRNLSFRPTHPKFESKDKGALEEHLVGTMNTKYEGLWKEIWEGGKIIRRNSHIPVSTPGSILLVLQAILPYLLLGPSAFPNNQDSSVPLRISIDGGTNVSKSPSIEYVSQVLLPMLSLRLGIPEITTVLHKRGWSTGGTQIGNVSFDITSLPKMSVLQSFKFEARGELIKVHVSILAPDAKSRGAIRDLVIAQLLALEPEVEILFPVDENSRQEKRWYLLLVAETSGGYRLGRDWLYDHKTKGIKVEETCAKLVSKVIRDLKQELSHGGCVDEYMQDQLVVFQSLVDGRATIDAGKQPASLHTKTARWVVEEILGVGFDESGGCNGVRFCVGENFQLREEKVGKAVNGVAEMEIK